MTIPLVTAQGAAPACSVEYSVTGQWDTGFQAAVTITDNYDGTPTSYGTGPRDHLRALTP